MQSRALTLSFVSISCSLLFAFTARSAELPELTLDELKCQKAAFNATATYMDKTFSARNDCHDRVIRQILRPTVDCGAPLDEGTGDDETDHRLREAVAQLSTSISTKCIGLSLVPLGYPGFCTFEGEDDDFASTDLEQCVREEANRVVEKLSEIQHPPYPGVVGGSDHNCQDLIARKSSRMFIREFEARSSCLIDQYERDLSLAVECRAEIDPFDPQTGDNRTDTNVVEAHNRVLRGIANECERGSMDALGFPHLCPHPGLDFTVDAVVDCMYQTHHEEFNLFIDIVNPAGSLCGNGSLDLAEQCDDGDRFYEMGQICQANCTIIKNCGDTNGDGAVTVADALYALRATVGLESCSIEICDATGDNRVTAADVLSMLQSAVGLNVTMACPAPIALTCGNDIIDDEETCDDGDTIWDFGQACNPSCQLVGCGDPNDSGSVTVQDAQFALQAAVGLQACDLAVCDVDNNGTLSTTDVQRILFSATNDGRGLRCPTVVIGDLPEQS